MVAKTQQSHNKETQNGIEKMYGEWVKSNRDDDIDIIINQGHELTPLPEGNQYLGYIFASADTSEQVVSAIREAYAKLKFVSARVFAITPS